MWYETSYRRHLIDMHIPDWDSRFLSQLDPEQYLRLLRTAGVDTAMVYASSCLGICYWPTRAGHMHSGIGGRDILGEVIDGCHDTGLNVVVYFNYWSKWACEQHPEWRIIAADGRGTLEYLWTPGHYGVCCPNSPYRDFVITQLEDLCARYDFEGMWIDMIFWPTICYCRYCQERYAMEVGGELPRVVDWRDPIWVRFQRLREQWLAELAAELTATVRRRKPKASIGHQCASWPLGWRTGLSEAFFREMDYVSGDFYGDALHQSFTCKVLYGLSERQRFEFMTSRCLDLSQHTTTKPRDLLRAHVYSALANNGAFLFIDAIDPLGTMDPRVYKLMGSIFEETHRYEGYLQPGDEFCQDVAIYFNFESEIDLRDNNKDVLEAAPRSPLADSAMNAAKALIDHNIPFGVITKKNLRELPRYQVVVLPDVAMLDDDEVTAFEAFVRDGGGLYASKYTSLLSKNGKSQGDFRLADVLGVHFLGETVESVTYMAPAGDGQSLFLHHTPEYPVAISGTQLRVGVDHGAGILATVTLPYTDPCDPARFSSAISNPPGIATDLPALTLRRYGGGHAIYAAGSLESVTTDTHRAIFAGLIRRLAVRPFAFESDAPKSVELTLFRQPDQQRYILNLLNYQAELPNISVPDIGVRLWLDGKRVSRVIRLPNEQPIPFEVREDCVSFTTPTVETFEMIAIDTLPEKEDRFGH
jgi:hypothetical protein